MKKFFLILSILIFCGILLPALLLQQPDLRAKLVHMAFRSAGYSFSASKTEFKYNNGIEFNAFDLKLNSDDGLFDVKVDKVSLTLKVFPLFIGQIRPSVIIAHSPEINIFLSDRDKSQYDDVFDELVLFQSFISYLPKLIEIDNGLLVISNTHTKIKDIFIRGTPTPVKGRTDIKAIAEINNEKTSVPFKIDGHFITSLIHSYCSFDISGDFFPVSLIPGLEDIYGNIAPNISASSETKGKLSLKGSIPFNNFSVEINKELKDGRYGIQEGLAEFTAELAAEILSFDFINLKTPDLNISGSGKINFSKVSNPEITVNVASNPVDMEIFKKYIPVQAFDSWLRTELIPSFISGTASLTHLGLKGRKEQILNIDEKENAKVLSLGIKVTDAQIKQKALPWEFQNVSGSVQIVNGMLKVDLDTANIAGINKEPSLKNCTFIMNSVYEDDPLMDFILYGKFTVTDITKLLTSVFIPKTLQDVFSPLILTEGILEITDPFIISAQSMENNPLTLNITKGTAMLKNCAVKLKDDPEDKTIIINAILKDKDGGINASSVTASVGNTILVKDGSFHINSDWPAMFSIAGDIALKDLYFLTKLGKVPDNYIQIFSELFYFDGIVKFKLNAELRKNNIFHIVLLEITNSDEPIITDFKYENTEVNLKLTKLETVFNSSKGGTIAVTGQMKNSSFEFNGNINTGMELSGILHGMIDWHSISNILGFDDSPLIIDGISPFNISLKGKTDEWMLGGDMGMDGVQGIYNSLYFGPLSNNEKIFFETAIQNGKTANKKIKFISGPSVCNIEIKNTQDGFSSIFSSDFFDISGLRLRYGFSVNEYGKGNISGNIAVNAIKPDSVVIDGFISCDDIFLPVEMYSYPIEKGKGHFSISGSSITFDSVQFEIGLSKLHAEGALSWSDNLSGRINILSPALFVEDIIPDSFMNKRQNENSPITFSQDADIDFAINADSAVWHGIKINDIKIKGVFKDNLISVTEGYALLSRSKISSAGKYSMATNQIDMEGTVSIASQPILALLESLGTEPFMTGDLSAELTFSINNTPVNEILKNINGTWKLYTENGEFKNSNIIFSILNALSIKDIFKDRGSGFHFSSIRGSGNISQGVIHSEEIVMFSPVFNSVLNEATLNLDSQEVKGNIHVSPLGTLDSIVSKIPLIGYILAGDDNTLMVLRFDLSGVVTEPIVTYRPFTGYPSSLLGYLKRVFIAPGKMIENLSKP